ncbi:hypothetical protein BJX66DRAFT_291843 [Aspergillus keveii]|uniref:Uncharacterized protein n=1 Tax=Aspergillus keveii TaxID=714993 RepID=A0ABR4GMR7_9EURO
MVHHETTCMSSYMARYSLTVSFYWSLKVDLEGCLISPIACFIRGSKFSAVCRVHPSYIARLTRAIPSENHIYPTTGWSHNVLLASYRMRRLELDLESPSIEKISCFFRIHPAQPRAPCSDDPFFCDSTLSSSHTRRLPSLLQRSHWQHAGFSGR